MSGKSYRRDRADKKKSQTNEKISEGEKQKPDAKQSTDEQTSKHSKEEPPVKDEIVNVEDDGDGNAVSEDKVNGGETDVINIEQMEMEKERLARETLDTYLLEARGEYVAGNSGGKFSFEQKISFKK